MTEEYFIPPEPELNITELYASFDVPIAQVDCGEMCAPLNPRGIPFCCDICQAVPVVYKQEWDFLQKQTDLWHVWRGGECPNEIQNPEELKDEVPAHLILLACKGPQSCQRQFRGTGCRQFPFFPYVTSDERFIGLAYEWEYEAECWLLSNLDQVTSAYREEFVRFYDKIFSAWEAEFESYYYKSEDIRAFFSQQKRRFPLLHRNGNTFLIDPDTEKQQKVKPQILPKFGSYQIGVDE